VASRRGYRGRCKKRSTRDHVRPFYLVRLSLLCFSIVPLLGESARVEFSPELAKWKTEIEDIGLRRIVAARIYMDASQNELLLPDDAEERRVIAALLRSPEIRAQLSAAYALTVNLDRGSARWSFILLNMSRQQDWRGAEEALLAHELGHVWLHAKSYRSPAFHGCEAIHLGDIVQHVLIREETARRKMTLEPYAIRTFELAYQAMKAREPVGSVEVCGRLAALSLALDVRASSWSKKTEFEMLLEARFMGVTALADELREVLSLEALQTKEGYSMAIESVAAAVKR
jgi:hypothetical protein